MNNTFLNDKFNINLVLLNVKSGNLQFKDLKYIKNRLVKLIIQKISQESIIYIAELMGLMIDKLEN